MVTAEDIGFWATVVASIATAVLVVIVWFQMRQTQYQMSSTLRPWLGAERGLVKHEEEHLAFWYMNYGELPPTSVKIKFNFDLKPTDEDDLRKAPFDPNVYIGTILPKQVKRFVIGGGGSLLKSVHDMKEQIRRTMEQVNAGILPSFFIGILIEYEYANNKRGEYGVIYEYTEQTHVFSIRREWVDKS